MKISKTGIVAIIVVIGIVVLIVGLAMPATPSVDYSSFAKCLTQAGAKMYGAYWCPHCQDQKEAFGKSWSYVSYVECATPGNNEQNQECSDAGIRGYPTWIFSNGQRVEGQASFFDLARLTNCQLPN